MRRLATGIRQSRSSKDLQRTLVIGIALLFGWAFVPPSSDAAGPLALGTQWLVQAQLPNGAWGGHLEVPATALAVRILAANGQDVAADQVQLRAVQSSDLWSRVWQYWGTRDPGLIPALLAHQRPDGSLGGDLSITAVLVSAQAEEGSANVSAVAFLRAAVNPDGGWGAGGLSTSWGTSFTLLALLRSGTPATDPLVAAAIAWIERHQGLLGDIGNTGDTAVALLALVAAGQTPVPATETTPANTSQRALDFLRASIASDGSWGQDEPLGLVGTTGLALLAVTAAQPTSPEISQGLAYLVATRAPGGGWRDPGTPLIATAAAVETLRAIDPSNAAIAPAIAFLQATPATTTETLARALAVMGATPADLLALQNPDGGWGLAAGFSSEPWTTALALKALIATGNGSSSNATQAEGWLLGARLPDGGWAYTPGETSRVAVTADVVRALGSVPRNLDIQGVLNQALSFLQSKRRGDAGYGDEGSTPLETALAVRALAAAGADLGPIAAATLTYLTGVQRSDGSWERDPYVTALALQAVVLLQNPPVPPTTGGVTAQVLDNATGQPLAGVTARRYGEATSVLTDAFGRFTLDGLAAGPVTLEFSKTGYLTQTGMATVTVGVIAPLGTIRLLLAPTTASVTGRVTHATAGTALSGVTVAATDSAGRLTATTGGDGSYSISGLTPGPLTLTASKTGYQDASATGTAVAGVTIQFSPALPLAGQTPPTTASVQATVLDATSRAPIGGVTLVLGAGGTAVTDAAGHITLTDVPVGTYTGTLSATGYLGQTFTAVLSGGSTLDLGTILLTSLSTPGSLTGLVVDAASNQPLSGVAMALASNPTVNAASLSSGVVILTNLSPGTVGFTVTKDGYVGLTRTATIAAGTATDLGILRLTPARTTATVRGTVTDATTGAALAGVQVQITGATILSATTNASGSYEFPEVIAGDVTLTASKAGYAPAVATTTLAAGIVLTFSPALGTGTGEGGTLLGSVLDGDTGEPFAGATVQLLGGNLPSGTTSATGAFSLPLFVDRPSLFYIEATAPGYLGETRYIVVFPDAPTYLAPFILARPGAGKIAGRVVAAETEAPLADVTVTVLGGDASAVTDETGAFTLTGLDAGGLSLALSKSGYGTARVDTAVARIGTTDVGDLFLAPFGPPPGADLALFPEDLVVSPAVPQPGALVSVAAVVRNLGTTDAAGTLQLYAGNPNLGGTLLTSAPVTVGATFRQTINLPSVAYPADRPQLFVVVSGVEPSDVDPRNNIVTPGRPPAAVATSALDAVKWLMSHQIPISSTQGAWIDYSVAYLNSYALRAYQVMGHTTAPRYQPAMTKMLEAQGPDGNFAGVVGTGHVIFALLDTGMSPDSPRIQDAASYLRRVQNADGSWASGGRGFAGRADVTGTVLAALLRTGTPKTDSAVVRAVTWLKTTQNSDGYWGDQAGAASNPFVSTYAVVGLALATSTTDSAVTRAKTYYDGWRAYHQEFLRYWLLMMRTLNPADSQIPSTVNNLLSYQRPDGGWSLSGYNYTDFALTAEVVAIVRGLGFTDPRLTTGLSWITLHINADGESFPDNQWIPTTGWATTALETNTLTADGKASVIAKARTTLVATQQGDGSWPNPIPPAPAPFIEPSALSVMALSVPPPASWTSDEQSAVSRGVNFLRNAQKKSGGASLLGGWPDYYWDAHVTQGASINALLGLLQARYSASDPEVSRGLTWLAGQQLPDGSWANSRDTAFAALIFQRAGVYPERVQRAIAWLLSNQNPNGGWGTLLGQSSGSSYSALGVMALSGAGERGLPVARGICYVQSVQRADGSWGGPTGTGQILWALTGAQVNQQVTLSLALNKAVYYPGDTIQVTVTAQGISPDQLTLQGTVSPQEGEVAAIAFTREADRFVATYPVPGTAIPGTWAVSVIGTGPTGETGVACATLPVKNPVGNAPDLAVFPADIAFSAGAGGSVTIGAAVRNLQAIDASDVVVRFYDGDPNGSGTVLGQVTLPRIEGGGIGLATLSWVPTGTRDIYVKTDPDNGIAETEEGNNLALRSFVPQGGTAPPSLTLGLDRAEYPANSEVQIALAMGNPLGTAGDFAVNLTVESAATGAQIASLPALSVTALAPGEARALATAWNDGTTPAGLYAVRGTLRDGAGATITTRLEQFRIVAGDGGQVPGRQLSSTVTTDRQTYDANQTAAITGSVSNPTPNAAWYNLLVSLQVLNDSGATVWSSNQTVASLAPLATSNLRFGFAIGSASPGTYTAVLGVTDTASGVVVDSRSATFQVVSSAATGTGLTGTLTATPGSPFRNVSVQLDISVRNSGNAAVDLAGLQILLVDPRTQTVLHTLPLASGSLAIGGERSDWVTATGGSLPAQAAKTSYVAVLQATLPGGLTKTLTSAAITVVDRPPVLSDPGPQTVNEGQTLVVTMAATDPDGDPISLSVSPLPSNASFTPETGTLTFAPDFTQANDYSVTVTASDGIVTGTRTVLIRVANINRPPAFAPLVNLGVNESEIVNLAVLASDPDGAASLTIAVENLPPFAEFTDLGSGQATIRFAPGFSDAGSYPGITVTVADHDPGNPLSNTKTFDVTVQNANRPPVLDQIANQSLAEGATLDIPVAATDPDGNGTLRLTLESAPAFASLTDNGGGQGILHLTPGYSDAGAYPGITVRADDQDAVAPLQAVQTFIVTVGNTNRPPQVAPIPDQTVAEGATLDVPVTATDPDGSSSLTLSLAGAPAFVTLTDTGNGQGILHIAPGSGTAASYLNVTLTADDHDSALPLQGSATFTLTVTPAGPTTLKAKVKIEPDTLNLKSHGRWVTAYIELPAGYDVADIDVATVALTRVKGRELTHPILAVSHPVAIGDKDHDGIPDLMVKFDRGQVERVVPVSNHVLLTVEGRLHTGQAFKGSDRIRVIRGGDHDHDDDDCDDDEDGRHHDPEDDHDSQRGKDRDNRRH